LREVLLTEPGHVEVRRGPEPEPQEGEVLVRTRTTGICGTDLSIFTGGTPVAYPRVPGHEASAVVEAGDLDPLSPGTRVVIDPAIACGRCYQCRRGQTNLCPNGALLGRERDGVFRELLTVPAGNLHPVPNQVPDHAVPLVQVLTTCVHAHRQTEIFPGDTVVVIGLGVTGLLHTQLARARGAGTVIGISRSRSKLELSRDLGADLAVDARAADVAAQVRDATDGRGADVVIECAGRVATLAQAVQLARLGGQVMAYGTISETEGALPFYDLYYKELRISSPRAAKPEDFPAAIALAASGSVRLEPLVTDRFPLDAVAEAFATAQRGPSLKVVVDL
jgi:2-desacetyl-2-hydroxyethyl bacteriochlorophyllide A dehydrogenase